VHFGRARIEQNVALWRGDQIGAILAAHPINVTDDSERFWEELLSLRCDERPQEQNCSLSSTHTLIRRIRPP
jgi:hypothetical protein